MSDTCPFPEIMLDFTGCDIISIFEQQSGKEEKKRHMKTVDAPRDKRNCCRMPYDDEQNAYAPHYIYRMIPGFRVFLIIITIVHYLHRHFSIANFVVFHNQYDMQRVFRVSL